MDIEAVIEVCDQYRLLSLTSNEILGRPTEFTVLSALMIKIGQPELKPGCPICIKDAKGMLKRLKLQSKRNKMAKSKTSRVKKYMLRSGISHLFKGAYVTRENLTDELARDMLLCNPRFISLFEKTPKDWEKDIQAKKTPAKEGENIEGDK